MGDADQAPMTPTWDETLQANIERAQKTMARAGFFKPYENDEALHSRHAGGDQDEGARPKLYRPIRLRIG